MLRWVLGGLAVATLWSAGVASACINESRSATNRDVRLTQRAERHLSEGRAAAAYRIVATLRQQLDSPNNATAQTRELHERLELIRAIATIRLEGGVNLHAANDSVSPQRRRAALERATELLRERSEADDNPVIQARYAEALARTNRAEALAILRALDEEDLMPDAWAYRTLADLEGDEGNHDARDRAHEACESRLSNSRVRRTVCGATPNA